jgi:molybdenum cofactor cytidylyltransferase
MSRSPAFAGVILAAGASSRMGRDKALLAWRGRTLLETHINLLQPETDMVIVVAGANAEALKAVVYGSAAFLALNPQPELGQFSSLRIGLQAVLNYGRDAAIIALVDRPPVSGETLRRLKSEFCNALEQEMWAVVPEIQVPEIQVPEIQLPEIPATKTDASESDASDVAPKHGHPILISREMIEAFLRAPVTSNARDVEHAHQDRIRYVPVTDAAVATNWNTPEDYTKGLAELHS